MFRDGNLNVSREQKINDVISRRLDWRPVCECVSSTATLLSAGEIQLCPVSESHFTLFNGAHLCVSGNYANSLVPGRKNMSDKLKPQ